MSWIGADACKDGWFAVRVREAAELSFDVFPTVGALWDAWGDGCDLLLINIPIGLCSDGGHRLRDAEARRLLRAPRASSVFDPPIRGDGHGAGAGIPEA